MRARVEGHSRVAQRQWLANAGYRSFFLINLAAFKYLTFELSTPRLEATCPSQACIRQPAWMGRRFDREPLAEIMFPPDPVGPISDEYYALFADVSEVLAGTPTYDAVSEFPGYGF